jgi:fused signal recognition particle receptor
MFDSLKKKLSGWIKSSTEKVKEVFIEETKEKPKEKKIKKKEAKNKSKKAAKAEKRERKKLSKEEKEKAQKVSQDIVEDIKKEGLEIKSPEVRFEEEFSEEEQEEAEEQDEKKEEKGFFARLKEKLTGKFKITENYFDDIFSELELLLLENNVALQAVEYIKEKLKKELIGKEIEKEKLGEEIKASLKLAVEDMLKTPFNLLEKIKEKQGVYIIVLFGINGSGKTTTIAKLANLLKKNNISVVLAAGDTFRAASIEQLQEHASRLKVEVIKSQYNADPASVAFDAIKHAQSKSIKVVLIDTAGRMHTKDSLMKEMEKIARVAHPDLKIFIGESITGNDATEQAKAFNDAVGIDAIILSKADVDEKPGALLSVSHVTGKPILYLGVGQEYKDLETFDKSKIIERLGL